ncbi:hypothetical protein FMN50_13755 [Rhodobacterales bacterium]|nr:hypothetical protein FMN50_13755 [Rhodobacterales bacterium]
MAEQRTPASRAIMTTLNFEKFWPYAVAIVFTVVWWTYLPTSFPIRPEGLLAATGTVAAVLVGFLVTAKAIVLGLTGSSVFKVLVNSGYHKILFRYLFEAVLGGLSLLVVAMIGFFLIDDKEGLPATYKIFWIFTATLSLCQFLRVLNLLFLFLKRV